jgi:predicted  nucleic acid-binding Zn-ribbon protein
MVESPTIESLREALAPVEAQRGEHSEFEKWVRESFAALDALHGELSEWQRDLTRQQAALDQREAALADGGGVADVAGVAELQRQLTIVRDEARQLEDENAEQLQTIEELDRQLAVAKAELRVLNKQAEDNRQLSAELGGLRRLMERQAALVSELTGVSVEDAGEASAAADEGGDVDTVELADDVAAKAAELRRRASSRRAAQRRSN